MWENQSAGPTRLCRGAATAASLRPVIPHHLIGEGAISQAIGMQFELVAPAQQVPAFDDRQSPHKSSRIAEGGGDCRGLDHFGEVNTGLPSVLKPEIDREVGVPLSVGNAVHLIYWSILLIGSPRLESVHS